MKINNKSRIYWACRRGMRELDIIMMTFFKSEYDTLTDHDQDLFMSLLKSNDSDLFNWLMNYREPQDSELKRIIKLIQIRINKHDCLII